MTAEQGPTTIPVPLARLVELAVESWRLDRWLAQCGPNQSPAPIRYAARRIADFLRQSELATRDLTGNRYEPGLAVEVVHTVHDPTLPLSAAIIEEMTLPICLWRGAVVRQGQAVIRSSTKPAA